MAPGLDIVQEWEGGPRDHQGHFLWRTVGSPLDSGEAHGPAGSPARPRGGSTGPSWLDAFCAQGKGPLWMVCPVSDDQVSTTLCRGVRGVCSSGWGQLAPRCQVGNRQEAVPASAMLQDPCPGPGVRSGSVRAQRPRVRAVEKVKRGGAGPRPSGQSLQWLPWARAAVGSQGQCLDGAACGKWSPWPWVMLW